MKIRDASDADAARICAIYNDAVMTTTAIWNDTPVDTAERLGWMQARRALGYPVLVITDASDQVMGYAAFGDWRSFEGYRHTVEHSVYVARDARGGGLGRQLLEALILRARALGKHAMVAGIEAGNAGSIALHRKLGFEQVGLLPQVGCKFGRWLDLAFLQLVLDHSAKPQG